MWISTDPTQAGGLKVTGRRIRVSQRAESAGTQLEAASHSGANEN